MLKRAYHEEEAGAVPRDGIAPRDIAGEGVDVRTGLEAAQVHVQALKLTVWEG